MLNAKQTEKLFKELIQVADEVTSSVKKFDNPLEGMRPIIKDLLTRKYKNMDAEDNGGVVTTYMGLSSRGANTSCNLQFHIDEDDAVFVISGYDDSTEYGFDDPFDKSIKFNAQVGYIEYKTSDKKDVEIELDEMRVKNLIKTLKTFAGDVEALINKTNEHDIWLEKQLKDLNKNANDIADAIGKLVDPKSDDPFTTLQPLIDQISRHKFDEITLEFDGDGDDQMLSIYFDINGYDEDVSCMGAIVYFHRKTYCLLQGYTEKLGGFDIDFSKSYKAEVYDGAIRFNTKAAGAIDIKADPKLIKSSLKSLQAILKELKKL